MTCQDIFRRRFLLLSLLLLLPGLAHAQETEAAVKRLMETPTSELDPTLPPESFKPWLRAVLPRGTALAFELNDCGEQAGDAETNQGRQRPACLAINADIISRNRALQLLFDRESLDFRGGTIFSPKLEGVLDVGALADLPARLKRPMRPFPIECPPGTGLRIKQQHAGVYEWCDDAQDRKQGPYRSWFNTGLYLMEKGAYKDGSKVGQWIECNRFERCASKAYPDSPVP